MKKLLGIAAISALAASAFAQGQVGFINNTAGLIRQWTSATDSTLISAPVGGAQVQLLYAPGGTALTALGSLGTAGFSATYTTLASFLSANPGWAAAVPSGGATAGIGPVAGRFNGGTATLTGIAGGANANYVVIGWTGAYASYDLAVAGSAFIGSGSMLTTATGNPGSTPPGTATLLSGTFTGLTLAPIVGGAVTPEPSTFALAGLGAAALMIFRRRK